VSVQIVGISGLKELQETLQRTLPQKLQGKVLQNALAKAGKPIIVDARARAAHKTGRLGRAIFSYRDKSSTRTRESRLISVRRGRKNQKSNRDAYYWKWVEFGHDVIVPKKNSGKSRSLGTPKAGWFGELIRAVPARPFMRPAFEAKKYAAIEAFKQSVMPEIKKVALQNQRRLVRAIRRKTIGV
jgi:HK97 gp10 family phage protein